MGAAYAGVPRTGFASEIDKTDRRILRVLQADGRISNLKLAEEVNLSPTAGRDRVKRLHRGGYILGYKARLMFVEILLDRAVHGVTDTALMPV